MGVSPGQGMVPKYSGYRTVTPSLRYKELIKGRLVAMKVREKAFMDQARAYFPVTPFTAPSFTMPKCSSLEHQV